MTKVSFAGTITSLSNGYEIPGINVGDAVAGVLVYDPATPDTQPLSWMGYYAGAIKSLSVTIGGKSYSLAGSPQSPASEINVINDDLVYGTYHDNLLFRAGVFEPANPSVVRFFQLTFGETASTPPTILTSDALPAKPMLDAFSFRRGFITYMPPGASQGNNMTLSSVSVITDWRSESIGIFRPSDGTFYLDSNASGQWDGCGTDRCLSIGMNGDIPLVGDWNGSGTSKVGAFRPSDGTFYLDYNGNGAWDGCGTDRCLQIGLNGDIPLVGDWNGSGTSKVGAFRPSDGTFYLDYNGSGTWDGCGTDRCLQIGMNGDKPLVGDWNGSGTSKVGAFRPSDGTFYLDYNGNGTWDGCGVDRCLQIGMLGDIPLVGDWNGTGTAKVGAFRPSDGTFYLDNNGSGTWEGCGTDRCLQIGMLNDVPLVGDWSGSGTSKVGVFRPSDGTFYLDYNGSGTWEGCGTDRCLQIGMSGDTPLVGKW
jgi:hypothetical protein